MAFVALITGFIDGFQWDLWDFVGFEVAFNGLQNELVGGIPTPLKI